MSPQIDVSIIIVNYLSLNLVKDCVSSIKKNVSGVRYEVIVVDNSDNQTEFENLSQWARENGVSVIDAKGNLGFGRANNLGVERARGRYLHFLNGDTVLLNDAVAAMFKHLEGHPDVGIVGCNLFTKEEKPNSSFIKEPLSIKGFKKKNRLINLFLKKQGFCDEFNASDEPLEVNGYVVGASLMMSKADFVALGGFDREIFMYAEESLLCYREIHELGKKVVNVPSGKIIHLEGGTTGPAPSQFILNAFVHGNYIYFLRTEGEDYALRFLKAMKRIYRRKQILETVLRMKNQALANKRGYIACKEKLASLNEKQ